MPATCAKSFLRAVVHRIGNAATAYHLWCAEQELRLVDTRDLEPSLREARERNLAVLREYRRRGQFPHHAHGKTLGLPCFIDAAGQQCAVACLMHASGDDAAALKVAAAANLARIADMRFVELDDWASTSGFTKPELARIQPGYPGDPPQLDDFQYATDLIYAIWAIGVFAFVSIAVNSLRLIITFAHRFTTSIVGILIGAVLMALSFQIDGEHIDPTRLFTDMSVFRLLAAATGALCVIFAIVPFLFRRAQREPSALRRVYQPSKPPSTSTGIKEMEGWN